MESRSTAPYLAQNSEEVDELLRVLSQHVGKKSPGGFAVRKKTYKIFDDSGRTVDSWGLNDWDYKKPNLPSYARGLFTYGNTEYSEIVARGYDKFFNVGEVNETEWPKLMANTRGPYELSVKENGCIIFIGGLDHDTLLVTSKHSTGHRIDSSANHALTGEQWVEKQLNSIGKSKADLAKKLRQLNVTAVAELCDDQFEEHVLEYNPEQAGLYLHGINLNLPEFATYPGNLVHDFADEWGFRKVQYIMKDTIEDVKPFLEEVAKTGNYNGRDTEGFVVRCQLRGGSGQFHDWFFKYKFEEPYLMYRQWREVTKAIIAGKKPKIKKHHKVTEEYIEYARRQLAKDPELGGQFNNNHGIIAMRNGFLDERGLKGHEIIDLEKITGNEDPAFSVTHNVMLVPIATIGCGKTTVALALSKLFGWGHEQNDNIVGKDKRARFVRMLTNLMAKHPVVFADRNNHQRHERAQIIDDVKGIVPDTTFIALHWVHDRAHLKDIKQFTQDRVLGRGDNHQTIHPDAKGSAFVIGIMDGFHHRFQQLNVDSKPDDDFDLAIELDPLASSRENLGTVVKEIHEAFPALFELPSEEAMDQAVDWALDYKPTIKHDLSKSGGNPKIDNNKKPKANGGGPPTNGRPSTRDGASTTQGSQGQQKLGARKPKSVEYFSIRLDENKVKSLLEATFRPRQDIAGFYTQLKNSNRIQQAFHVTLMHRASQFQNQHYWQQLNDLWAAKSAHLDPLQLVGRSDNGIELGTTKVELESIVFNGRLMAITVKILGDHFKSQNNFAHITIGTADESIKPKESNEMLIGWAVSKDQRYTSVEVRKGTTLDGSVRAVLSS